METVPEVKLFEEYGMGGSVIEAVGGFFVIVLAIIGLSGVRPLGMVAVSDVIVGLAFLIETVLMSAEYSEGLSLTGQTRRSRVEWAGGLGAQAIAGIGPVLLGVLALLGVSTEVLVACSTILLGAGVLFGSGVHDRVRTMRIGKGMDDRVVREILGAATGAELLVGLSAIILGILALAGLSSTVLNLVAVLVIGISTLWSGAAAGTHFYYLSRH